MLLFCDSFDHYNTATLPEKYSFSGGATIVSPGRTGANCLEFAYGSGGSVQQNFASQSQFIVGVAFNPQAFGSGNPNNKIIVFFDQGMLQGALVMNESGGLEYQTFPNGEPLTIASSAGGVITLGAWQYLEISVVFSPTAGSVVVQLNGINVVIDVTGVNTSTTGNSTAGSVQLTDQNSGNGPWYFDDFYICNEAGAYNNSFLGDVAIDCVVPDAAGQSTQWTPNGGTDPNWEIAAQIPPGGSSGYYLSSSVVGDFDLYEIASLPGSNDTIVGVQIVASAYKDDSGARVLGVGFGNGTTYIFNAGFPLGGSYIMYEQTYDINPITNQAWVETDINSGQIGIKVIQ
jgi:hypothetical protein